MGGDKEDVGRIRFRVKDDATKSSTNCSLEFGAKMGQRKTQDRGSLWTRKWMGRSWRIFLKGSADFAAAGHTPGAQGSLRVGVSPGTDDPVKRNVERFSFFLRWGTSNMVLVCLAVHPPEGTDATMARLLQRQSCLLVKGRHFSSGSCRGSAAPWLCVTDHALRPRCTKACVLACKSRGDEQRLWLGWNGIVEAKLLAQYGT